MKRYVIYNILSKVYYTSLQSHKYWTEDVGYGNTYNSLEDAEIILKNRPPGFYEIKIIYMIQ